MCHYVAASTRWMFCPMIYLQFKTGVIYIEYFIIQPNSCALNHFAFMCSEA